MDSEMPSGEADVRRWPLLTTLDVPPGEGVAPSDRVPVGVRLWMPSRRLAGSAAAAAAAAVGVRLFTPVCRYLQQCTLCSMVTATAQHVRVPLAGKKAFFDSATWCYAATTCTELNLKTVKAHM